MIIVGFPTRFEASGLISALKEVKKGAVGECPYFEGQLGKIQIVVAILGMGPMHSARRARLLLEHFSPELFILAGFAGGLVGGLKKGQVFFVENGCSEVLREKSANVARVCSLSEPVTSAKEKRSLAEESGCQLVDMETEAVFAVAQEKGVKMLTVRVVSDLADENLPIALAKGYDFSSACETPWRLFFYLLFHPRQLAPFLRFLEALPSVRRELTSFLEKIILGSVDT